MGEDSFENVRLGYRNNHSHPIPISIGCLAFSDLMLQVDYNALSSEEYANITYICSSEIYFH
jgi:hypothetical protein